MEFWFSEFHTPDVKHSIRVSRQLYSKQSDYQRIDIFETPEFGRVLTLDGNVMLTERGTTFGYQDLVVDYRGIPEMQSFGYPVILDVTHSLQQPNQTSGVTGGMPQLIETVAKAGIAVGADGLFIETHENPAVAKSDGANMLRLDLLEGLLTKLVRIREAIK